MPQFQLRRATASDLEAAVAVWVRARWSAQPWLEERMGHSDDENLHYFREVVMPRHEVWLAEESGVVLGLLALAAGHVDQLHVEPTRQGEGIGSALLEHAKRLSPDGLTLFTHQRNTRARAFYERHGFRAVAFGASAPPESEPDVRYAWSPEGRR